LLREIRRAGRAYRQASSVRAVKSGRSGVRQGWDAIIGSDGIFVGMAGFGAGAL
jgi:hypothetical protein